MLSYRHAFHAGNHADVLKHLILTQIADYMGADVYRTTIRSNVIIKEAQAVQENVFDYIESKAQTKGERVSEASRNFVNDCLNFVKEFVEKEREQ